MSVFLVIASRFFYVLFERYPEILGYSPLIVILLVLFFTFKSLIVWTVFIYFVMA